MQRSMLAHEALADRPIYNMPLRFGLTGTVDEEVLGQAFRYAVRRHPALSAHYDVDVAVLTDRPAEFELSHVTCASPEDAAAALGDLWDVPFDLAAELPVRARLVSVAPGEYHLGICVHHVAGDSWSLTLLLNELGSAYATLCRGGTPDATGGPDFFDHAAREQVTSWDHSWWRERLRDVRPQPFPREIEPDEEDSGRILDFPLRLDAAHTRGVRRLAREARVSPATVLFAAVSDAVSDGDTTRETVVGLPVALRDTDALQRTVGPLLNTLPVRTSWRTGVAGRGIVHTHAEAIGDAMAHKEMPLSQILRAAEIRRVPGTAPLFLHLVNIDTEVPRLRLPGIRATAHTVPLRWAQLPACWEFGWATVGNLEGTLRVATDAFDEELANMLVADFRSSLARVLSDL
ncbi:hypothetical protein IW245_000217 [Longispora fulva]|uniref:Condensation domain-containing protein n=2 Tax=Longispora fulva TaxID=619741 RepID=A0A8J7GLZ6_9ACTN|nr:hypothetical protein [Longispora fulva]